MNANEKAVAAVLAKYQDALNQSNTDAVMRLYASDGVFMPQNSPSSVGADEIRRAYDAVFRAIKLTVQFNVAEVVRAGSKMGLCTHQFGRDGQGSRDRRRRPGGQSGTFPVSENRWNLEDRALLFFHN